MEQCLCRLEPNRLNRIVRFLRRGLIIFLFGMGYAFARKVRAASNPWGAGA